MEAFSPYFFSVGVALVSFFSFLILGKLYDKTRSKLPPGTHGFPIIGETLQFVSSGPENFIHQRMEKYSDQVFRTSLVGEKMAVVCGAVGNKFLLYSANDSVLPWFPASVTKLLNWVDADPSSLKEVISKSRSFLHNEILRPESLRDYIAVMDSVARQHIKTDWEPFREVKVHPLCHKYTLSLACRLLLGVEDPSEAKRISDSFTITMKGMFALPLNLPGTTYSRALKEVNTLKQEFLRLIAQKRKIVLENRERAGSDVLSRTLVDGKDHFSSDSEIAVYLLGLMLPSYESISAAITFVLKHLAELPHIYDMVYKEHMEIAKSKAPQELLNWEDIKKMKYCWNVICETMRLTPPSLGTFREVKNDIHFGDFTIPKGWKILWSPFTTNKNSKYFPDPETFDPTRHDGDGPTPCTFIPFSAGPRMCPGKEYSMLVILVFIYNVVGKFKLEKLIPNEKILYNAGPVPANGLPIRLHPH